jgi:hypothetical protein
VQVSGEQSAKEMMQAEDQAFDMAELLAEERLQEAIAVDNMRKAKRRGEQ